MSVSFQRGLGRWVARPWLALLCWMLLPSVGRSATAVNSEYQVKAVFLYNFAQFVDWPATVFSNDQAPLVIGILGEDPFGPALDELVRGEVLNNRPLVIQRYPHVENLGFCHILYISSTENSHLDTIFNALRNRSTLTVGETDAFGTRGGMIRFLTDNHKIRLRINLASSRAAKLTISSKLLRPAEVVGLGND